MAIDHKQESALLRHARTLFIEGTFTGLDGRGASGTIRRTKGRAVGAGIHRAAGAACAHGPGGLSSRPERPS